MSEKLDLPPSLPAPAELSDVDLERVAAGAAKSPGGVGGPASGLGVRPGVGVGAPGLGMRRGYDYGYGGVGGPYSGLGVRPGLGVGAPGLGWRRGLG